MPLRLYRIYVFGAALAWMMFGFQSGTILQGLDAGVRPDGSELLMTGMWLLMGVGDVWLLLRELPGRGARASDGSAPAT